MSFAITVLLDIYTVSRVQTNVFYKIYCTLVGRKCKQIDFLVFERKCGMDSTV